MFGYKTKLLISHQSALITSSKMLPNRIFSNNLPIVSKRLMGR